MGSWTRVLKSMANLALVAFVFQMMIRLIFWLLIVPGEIVKIDMKFDGYDFILIDVKGISYSEFYDDSKSFLNILLMQNSTILIHFPTGAT